MSQDKKNRKLSFIASLLLHLLVFLGGFFYLAVSPPTLKAGEEQVKYMASYLYQPEQLRPVLGLKTTMLPTKQASPPQQEPQPLKQRLPKDNLPVSNTASHEARAVKQAVTAASVQAQSSSSGEQAQGLLALLHSAIQSKQQYPASAQQLGRQGRVQVGFKLYTDGTISNLQLMKSSGTSSLDAAALAAVRLAVPFQQVNTYLKTAEDFTIDVLFALGEEN